MGSQEHGGSISTEESDGVLVLRLDNPRKKNALDNPTYLAIVRTLEDAAANPRVTAVIVTGTGDYFCSGTDVAGE